MRRFACAVALAGALGITATASAEGPAWLEPASLSGEAASSAAVALAAPGDAVAVWARSGAVESRLRPPAGAYAPAATLADSGASAPDVDVAPDGTAVAAWAEGQSVAYAVRPPGGSFTRAPQPLTAGSGDVSAVRVLVDRSGDALIAYSRGGLHASIRPAGAAAGEPVTIASADACDLDAAAGAGGRWALVWRDCAGNAIRVARRTASGFGTPLEVATGTAPAVAVDADGTTVAAWVEAPASVRTAAAAPDGQFGDARTLASGAGHPALAATTDGVWAAWRTASGARIVASRRPTGGQFANGGTVISADGVAAEAPALAGAGDGSVVAAWVRPDGESRRVESARRVPGSDTFQPALLVSAANAETGGLELDGDEDGNVLAGYLRGGIATVQTLDAAGPRFNNVEMRTAGFALDPYPFAVDAVDAWSSVDSTSFAFGDGSSAPGPRAEHAFPAQGEYTVTVSGIDALGNASSTTRTFSAAPPLDRTAPVISKARLDVTRFRLSRTETAVVAAARKKRRGSRFRYTLSEPAQVNIFFERVLMGRKRGKVCRRGNRRGKKCRVYQPAGLITRSQPAGKVSVGFSGRIVGRTGLLKVVDVTLKPGRYRATIVAADATRNISKPVQLAFTLLR